MKALKKNLIVISILLLLLLPMVSSAALVPCATEENPDMCTLCDLFSGIQKLIKFGAGIVVIVCVFIIVIGGIIYIVSSGDSGMMEKAKGAIKAAVVGFAIFLCAWLIVNAVFAILGARISNVTSRPWYWYEFNCSTSSGGPQAP